MATWRHAFAWVVFTHGCTHVTIRDNFSGFHVCCAEAVQRFIKGAAEESLGKEQQLQSQIDR